MRQSISSGYDFQNNSKKDSILSEGNKNDFADE